MIARKSKILQKSDLHCPSPPSKMARFQVETVGNGEAEAACPTSARRPVCYSRWEGFLSQVLGRVCWRVRVISSKPGSWGKPGGRSGARRCVRFQLSWDTSLSTLSHTPVRPDPLLLHKGPHSQAKAERNTDRSISTS